MKATDALPQLELFQLDPLPKVRPTRVRTPPPPKECPECGRQVKRFGELCHRCIVRRPMPEEAKRRVCCGKCPEGECYAIPF